MKHQLLPLFLLFTLAVFGQNTERLYLSGKGPDDNREWDFFCTDGRKSGYWTKIKVPSNWEFQGFGTFNYGFDEDSIRGKESGLYKYRFTVPENWKNKIINIVFEGSMTDTEVKINGRPAGPVHRGSFYRFKYNITSFLHYKEKNLLEIKVDKHSSNESVNQAERICDFWIFGGVFRPVYLEALPKEHISYISVDAKATGDLRLRAEVNNIARANKLLVKVTDKNGKILKPILTKPLKKGQDQIMCTGKFENINQWSPELPERYKVSAILCRNEEILHVSDVMTGFRTVQLKTRDGIYINGEKIKFKGINRHSFWPTSGRTLSFQQNLNDVLLMKDMNMNAVRTSHYPPDKCFLDICDSLGLFVIDEITGWQKSYDTLTATSLAKEFVCRDINHPSVIIWANGNEGGWNLIADDLIDKYDIQKRPVIHPWQIFRGTDTQHYKDYNYGTGTHQNGREVVFPTEFLHGLYDGGHGAGLEDYWNQMWYNPISAGGFLWAFCDEGVVRNDLDGIIDTNRDKGADGIVGPFREKEGSYFTIKEIWSPVFFEKKFITHQFDGRFPVENRYHFTNLDQCRFEYRFVSMPAPGNQDKKIIYHGLADAPDIPPGHKGVLHINLPQNWGKADLLYIKAFDPHGQLIYEWSWAVKTPHQVVNEIIETHYKEAIEDFGYYENNNEIILFSVNLKVAFEKKTGVLKKVSKDGLIIPLNNGPRLCEGEPQITGSHIIKSDTAIVFEIFHKMPVNYQRWTMYPNGILKLDFSYWPGNYNRFMGINFDFPEENIKGMEWFGSGPYRVWKNRMKGNKLNVWSNTYNNTITGEGKLFYPEFKGYFKNLYWVEINADPKPFRVYCASEDVFLRMLTPERPRNSSNPYIAPLFPDGNISFMHGITPIGTKFRSAEKLGPMGDKNLFVNFWRRFSKDLELFFDFN